MAGLALCGAPSLVHMDCRVTDVLPAQEEDNGGEEVPPKYLIITKKIRLSVTERNTSQMIALTM